LPHAHYLLIYQQQIQTELLGFGVEPEREGEKEEVPPGAKVRYINVKGKT
jgi:hypothetical protein